MRRNKTIKDLLNEKNIEENIRQDLVKTQEISDNTTIIVQKKSKIISFIMIFLEIIKIILKVVIVVIMCVLTTIGGTILINSELRIYFCNIVSQLL